MLGEGLARITRNWPIDRKIRSAIVGTSSLTLFIVILSYSFFEWYFIREQLQQELEVRAQIIASNSVAALTFNDSIAAAETLQALRAGPEIEVACIFNEKSNPLIEGGDGEVFAQFQRADINRPCPERPQSEYVKRDASHISLSQAVDFNGDVIGLLYIRSDMSPLWSRLTLVAQVSALLLLASILLASALAGVMQRLISRPVVELARVAGRVSESKDYSLRAEKSGDDEIGHLIDVFNDMLAQTAIRDGQLQLARDQLADKVLQAENANSELQVTLEQLQSAQDQLVQTEKMASLGGLVAGVAHEINTPVGIGVTAASTLVSKGQELKEVYESGRINRSQLDAFVESVTTISQMILTNLQRAAELIQSFKQVAVDQSSSERRQFILQEYLEEILLSLGPQLKKTNHHVNLDCPPNIVVDSYPGAVSQTVTNLVVNSLLHAWDEGDSGVISIEVTELPGDRLQLHYHDDGKGLPAEHRDRIFEPFFTTRRGSGGSGLGMHIVYNLVCTSLGGSIELGDKDLKGFHMLINLPLRVKK